MKTLLAILVPLLAGCAGTTFYGPSGSKVARFEGDMTDLVFSLDRHGRVAWTAATVDHSSATKAAGTAVNTGIGAAGSAASAILLAR